MKASESGQVNSVEGPRILDGACEVVWPQLGEGERQAGILYCWPFSEQGFQASGSWLYVHGWAVPVVRLQVLEIQQSRPNPLKASLIYFSIPASEMPCGDKWRLVIRCFSLGSAPMKPMPNSGSCQKLQVGLSEFMPLFLTSEMAAS